MRRAARTPAFSLVELLVTIAIIAVLMGLVLAGISAVRKSQKRTESQQLVAQLHQAMGVYAQMDRRGKFPGPDPGGVLLADAGVGALLVEQAGYLVQRPRLVATPAGSVLGDAWGRPLRYAPDLVVDGDPARPAPQPDWNPKGREPYPYLWSLGVPTASEAEDALPASAVRWLYHAESP